MSISEFIYYLLTSYSILLGSSFLGLGSPDLSFLSSLFFVSVVQGHEKQPVGERQYGLPPDSGSWDCVHGCQRRSNDRGTAVAT